MKEVDWLVIHHSAGASGNVKVFRQEHLHRTPPFTDIGYHRVIGNGKGSGDGQIETGRPEDREGAGVFGNNGRSLHVCLVGNFHKGDAGYTGKPSMKQMASLGSLLHSWGIAKARGGFYPHVVGHRERALKTHPTACPGNEFPLTDIRAWYNAAVVHRQTTLGLVEWLDNTGFWDGTEVEHQPTFPLVTFTTERTGFTLRGIKEPDGRIFVSVRELADQLGWSIVYDVLTGKTTVHTK